LTNAPISLLQTEFGLILSLMQIEMPLMLLPLIAVIQRVDPRMIDASRALGASRWRTTFQVLIPLSLSGWIAGATLVFASSTTAFISQSVIGGQRLIYLPAVIYQQSMVIYNWPFAAVASIMLLVSVLGGIFLIAAVGRWISREAS
jgi:putative spermidine/putrescine transport system permease protein